MRSVFLILFLFFISITQTWSQNEDVSQYFAGSASNNTSQYIGINFLKLTSGSLMFEYSIDFMDMFYFRVAGGPVLFDGFSFSDVLSMDDSYFEYRSGYELEAYLSFCYAVDRFPFFEKADVGVFYNQRNNVGDTSTQVRNTFGFGYGYHIPLTTKWYLRPSINIGITTVKIKDEPQTSLMYGFENKDLYYSIGLSLLKSF